MKQVTPIRVGAGMMRMRRNRLLYIAMVAIVTVAGLASRSDAARYIPAFIATYAGDTLWALTVFLTLGFIFPRASILTVASSALLIAFGVEISQLYQADWIIQIRETLPGRLFLGSGFKWSDLVCYSIGVLMGGAGELLVKR
jgi:hypothetical protein